MLSKLAKSSFLFLLAGLAEIGGGYFIWIWLRNGAGIMWNGNYFMVTKERISGGR